MRCSFLKEGEYNESNSLYVAIVVSGSSVVKMFNLSRLWVQIPAPPSVTGIPL